jgi:hypothetical protein
MDMSAMLLCLHTYGIQAPCCNAFLIEHWELQTDAKHPRESNLVVLHTPSRLIRVLFNNCEEKSTNLIWTDLP